MNLKDRYYDVLDRWDRFAANKFQTHLACGVAGVIVGIYLASLVWK